MTIIEGIAKYVEGAQAKINERYADDISPAPQLTWKCDKRYAKVIKHTENQTFVFAFIDLGNGDILKPASWRAPAKHARGNVLDADNGLSRTIWTGPEYLK